MLPSEATAAAEIAAAVGGRQRRGIEDEILRLESVLPGFGGFFLDSTGTLVVYAPAGMSPVTVKSSLSTLANRVALGAETRARLANSDSVRVIAGEFAFSQLIAWQTAITARIAAVPHISGIDADEMHNRVRVFISDESARSAVQAAAVAAQLPEAALVIDERPQMLPLSNVRGTFRPTGGGLQLQVSSGKTCTLGYNVTTSVPNQAGFITASHCAPGQPGIGTLGATFYQPMIGPQYAIGTVTVNPAWTVSNPVCGGQPRCTYADVLFVTHSNPANLYKAIVRTAELGTNNNGGSITFKHWETSLYTVLSPPPVGTYIQKIGPVTGWTQGVLWNSCVNTPMVDTYGPYLVLCTEVVTGARVGEGDSGAPVFDWGMSVGTSTAMYGILIGGGPMNASDGLGFGQKFCNTNCTFIYSSWPSISTALGFPVYPNL